jgi:class 3 adenylate cyclase
MSNTKDFMAHTRALRNVLKRNSETLALITKLAATLALEIYIEDSEGTSLLGTKSNLKNKHSLCDAELNYGALYSHDTSGQFLAEFVSFLVKKELEKKKIGQEVLGLYREINMIYNFSEMISEKIDDVSIAVTALQEACQIINATHGIFLVYEPEENRVIEMAAIGDNPNSDYNISDQSSMLKELIRRGTAAIVPVERIKSNPALSHLKTVMYAPLKVKHRTLGMIILGHQEEVEFTAAELKLLTTIALQSAAAIESAQLYQKGLKESRDREEAIKKIHEVSQKFVPHEFIKSLGKDKLTEVALGDQVEREVTVMFTDIRGFTALSERLAPKENFLFINSFNKRMGPIIRNNEGFIMQYLGDGFMAIFPNGSQNALRASVEMHLALAAYNKERIAKKRTLVQIGIGMQNGKLIMGITGDVERMDAAIISDTVNTASRIEGLSKHYGTSILLTDLCKNNLSRPEEFDFRFLGPVQVQGKKKPIDLYECINGDNPDLRNHKLNTLSTFEHAMELYFNKEFAMSAVTFQQIVKMNRDDHTAKLFLNRAAHLITQEIGDDWKGVESITKK